MSINNNKRTNGVTLVINGRVLVTQEPVNDDVEFVHTTSLFHQQWIKDGKPQSNQGY